MKKLTRHTKNLQPTKDAPFKKLNILPGFQLNNLEKASVRAENIQQVLFKTGRKKT